VLLVHGFGTSSALTWGANGWIDLLREAGRDVIGVDLLGHGTAPKPHDPAAYADLEANVAAQLPDGAVDAIGFSLGARVVLALAAERSERFRRIVVAGVGANLFRNDDHAAIVRAVRGEPIEGDDADVAARYFAGLAELPGNDRAALAACMARPGWPLKADDLGRIDRPVLVVLGDRDFAGPADPLVAALPDARLVNLRGVDHAATPKNFGFIDAALEFLDALPG
jgi:pimeloyl-ACP methyl ester carboxylesterase